jgi:glucose/arabinose dehydrogenase
VLAQGAAPASAAVHLASFGTFSKPIFVTAPPGDTSRVFVVERAGTIQVVSGGVRKQFLDITPSVDTTQERGLLSMAFAPDYATSGLLYVFYTAKAPLGNIRVDEFQRSASDPDMAVATGRVIVDAAHSQSNHNGGQLQFGPDGYLYVSIGDNATKCNAPNLGVPYGKVLRIDPRAGQPLAPADNPFSPPADARVWSSGLRNPWRFSFDRQTGDLVIADVGEGSWEEVDYVPASSGGGKGLDFGWPAREGLAAGPAGCPSAATTPTNPVLVYDHSAGRCAITGGYVVRADDLPSLAGRYVYGDYCSGAIRSAQLGLPAATGDRAENLTVSQLYSFGEDGCGHVYALSGGGTVYRITEADTAPTCQAAAPPPAVPTEPAPPGTPAATDTTAPVLTVTFRSRQRAAQTRALLLGVRSSEPCTVTPAGTVTGTGRGGDPRPSGSPVKVTATATQRLRLTLSARGAARIRRALGRHMRVWAQVRLTATDRAGNRAAPKTVRIRITG